MRRGAASELFAGRFTRLRVRFQTYRHDHLQSRSLVLLLHSRESCHDAFGKLFQSLKDRVSVWRCSVPRENATTYQMGSVVTAVGIVAAGLVILFRSRPIHPAARRSVRAGSPGLPPPDNHCFSRTCARGFAADSDGKLRRGGSRVSTDPWSNSSIFTMEI